MGDAGFFRGTSSEQDNRFTDKQKKLLKTLKFHDNLSQKVDVKKVNMDILKPWITTRVNDILGLEDDVVTEYIFSQLEEKNMDPRLMQINLTGFLNAKRAREFMAELWQMMLDAQATPDGIPPQLIEMKKEELKKRLLEEEQSAKDVAALAQQLSDRRDNSDRAASDARGREREPYFPGKGRGPERRRSRSRDREQRFRDNRNRESRDGRPYRDRSRSPYRPPLSPQRRPVSPPRRRRSPRSNSRERRNNRNETVQRTDASDAKAKTEEKGNNDHSRSAKQENGSVNKALPKIKEEPKSPEPLKQTEKSAKVSDADHRNEKRRSRSPDREERSRRRRPSPSTSSGSSRNSSRSSSSPAKRKQDGPAKKKDSEPERRRSPQRAKNVEEKGKKSEDSVSKPAGRQYRMRKTRSSSEASSASSASSPRGRRASPSPSRRRRRSPSPDLRRRKNEDEKGKRTNARDKKRSRSRSPEPSRPRKRQRSSESPHKRRRRSSSPKESKKDGATKEREDAKKSLKSPPVAAPERKEKVEQEKTTTAVENVPHINKKDEQQKSEAKTGREVDKGTKKKKKEKKPKKEKKHKKHKKRRKPETESSESESQSEEEEPKKKRTDHSEKPEKRDDLEKVLREKALQSMKKQA